jgi:hypothetical protein
MIWLFHRYGEYLSCEVRTCLENTGFELLIARAGRVQLEWYADELQIERRWEYLNRELRRGGWGELYTSTNTDDDAPECQVDQGSSRR